MHYYWKSLRGKALELRLSPREDMMDNDAFVDENDRTGIGEADFEGFLAADSEHIRRERAKAAELRKSQWWKNLRGQGKCHYCGRQVPPRELTMDHLIPLARGGTSAKSNIVPCCKECNNKKKYLLPNEIDEQ